MCKMIDREEVTDYKYKKGKKKGKNSLDLFQGYLSGYKNILCGTPKIIIIIL